MLAQYHSTYCRVFTDAIDGHSAERESIRLHVQEQMFNTETYQKPPIFLGKVTGQNFSYFNSHPSRHQQNQWNSHKNPSKDHSKWSYQLIAISFIRIQILGARVKTGRVSQVILNSNRGGRCRPIRLSGSSGLFALLNTYNNVQLRHVWSVLNIVTPLTYADLLQLWTDEKQRHKTFHAFATRASTCSFNDACTLPSTPHVFHQHICFTWFIARPENQRGSWLN